MEDNNAVYFLDHQKFIYVLETPFGRPVQYFSNLKDAEKYGHQYYKENPTWEDFDRGDGYDFQVRKWEVGNDYEESESFEYTGYVDE